jgi:hypothetical protein
MDLFHTVTIDYIPDYCLFTLYSLSLVLSSQLLSVSSLSSVFMHVIHCYPFLLILDSLLQQWACSLQEFVVI